MVSRCAPGFGGANRVVERVPARPLDRQFTSSLAAPPAFRRLRHRRPSRSNPPRLAHRAGSSQSVQQSVQRSHEHAQAPSRIGTACLGRRARRGERTWERVPSRVARPTSPRTDDRAAAPGPVGMRLRTRARCRVAPAAVTQIRRQTRCRAAPAAVAQIGRQCLFRVRRSSVISDVGRDLAAEHVIRPAGVHDDDRQQEQRADQQEHLR